MWQLAVAVYAVHRHTCQGCRRQSEALIDRHNRCACTDTSVPAHHLICTPRQAAEELARGQQQGWAANAQVYEAMITALCKKDHLSDAIDTFNRMKVPPCMQAEDSPEKQLCIVCPALAAAPLPTQQ